MGAKIKVKSPPKVLNKAGKARRSTGKVLLLASTYGMSGATAGARLGKSKKDGEELLEKFFTKFPKVKLAIEQSKEMAKRNGYVEDWAGRRRHLPEINYPAATARYKEQFFDKFNPILGCKAEEKTELNDENLAYWASLITKNTRNAEAEKIVQEAAKANPAVIISLHTGQIAQAERQCFNARIQGGAASLTKLAMINIDKDQRLRELDTHLVMSIHDEVLACAPALYAEEAGKRVAQIMIDTAKPYINVPMKCDEVVVPRWYCDEAAAGLKEELQKLEEKVNKQEALQKLYNTHPEYDKEAIDRVIKGETDILEF